MNFHMDGNEIEVILQELFELERVHIQKALSVFNFL
jgi:hypothetical protein